MHKAHPASSIFLDLYRIRPKIADLDLLHTIAREFSHLPWENLTKFLKKHTGRVEAELAAGGRRRVNLDPGYLDHSKLVLASLKPAPDKIYLGHGVWAHTCARYGDGRWSAPGHSFPDFEDGRFDGFLAEARQLYRRLLRSS